MEGRDYIVYAHEGPSPEGGYAVGICSRTALLQEGREDVAPAWAWLAAVLVAFLVLLGLVAVAYRRVRRR